MRKPLRNGLYLIPLTFFVFCSYVLFAGRNVLVLSASDCGTTPMDVIDLSYTIIVHSITNTNTNKTEKLYATNLRAYFYIKVLLILSIYKFVYLLFYLCTCNNKKGIKKTNVKCVYSYCTTLHFAFICSVPFLSK